MILNKKQEVEQLHDMVFDILYNSYEARNSDRALIMQVVHRLGYKSINDDNIDYIPSFESITRARRKIQETNGDLKASEHVKRARISHQLSMKTYL